MKMTGIGHAALIVALGVLAMGPGCGADAATASITAIPPRHATVKLPTAQQLKMKRCISAASVRKLNGAPRQNFIKYCFKQPVPARPSPPATVAPIQPAAKPPAAASR